jgi:hypothetical protein
MSKLLSRARLLILVVLGVGVTLAGDAFAIIGRPLTPFSYAGVARRTVRRSAYYNYNYYY